MFCMWAGEMGANRRDLSERVCGACAFSVYTKLDFPFACDFPGSLPPCAWKYLPKVRRRIARFPTSTWYWRRTWRYPEKMWRDGGWLDQATKDHASKPKGILFYTKDFHVVSCICFRLAGLGTAHQKKLGVLVLTSTTFHWILDPSWEQFWRTKCAQVVKKESAQAALTKSLWL